MAATTWHPHNTIGTPKRWLLADGSIASAPALEQTSTGRKVRIAGTDISAYTKDLDDLVLRAVEAFAAQNKTSVWMGLHRSDNVRNRVAGFNPDETKAELYILKKETRARTIAWWRFKHPTLPIEAIVTVQAGRVGFNAASDHEVKTKLVAPDTTPTHSTSAKFVNAASGHLAQPMAASLGGDIDTARNFIRDTPATVWNPMALLGGATYGAERLMVEALLAKVREVDELTNIEILDLRNPAKPAWLELELVESNVNATFLSDLTEYLDGTPTVAEALRLYTELQECLRGIGLVLDEKTENDFQKGLIGNQQDAVTVDLGRPRKSGTEVDHEHRLHMHLPTGTFIVDCSATIDLNATADRWEESRVLASLSGEEDTLLAFAREAAKRGQKERARAIIRERRGSANR